MLANKFINFGDLLFSVVLIAAILKKKNEKIMKGRAVYWEITGCYQFLIYDFLFPATMFRQILRITVTPEQVKSNF